MKEPSVKRIRVIACALGVIALLSAALGLHGGVSGFDIRNPSRTVSLQEGWSVSWIALQGLLLVAAIGLWRLHSWARWICYFWFTLLLINNMAVEYLQTHAFPSTSAIQGLPIAGFWLWGLYSDLISAKASLLFKNVSAKQA